MGARESIVAPHQEQIKAPPEATAAEITPETAHFSPVEELHAEDLEGEGLGVSSRSSGATKPTGEDYGVPDATPSRGRAASISPRLRPCIFGSHAANLKGEDGLRVERLTIGEDVVTAALLVDGHGGHQAAALVVEDLFHAFAENARGSASSESLKRAATESFRGLHEQMRSPSFGSTAGTTATFVVVNETRGEITCCNVGDSFALLVAPPEPAVDGSARSSSKPKPVTTVLTANPRLEDSESERERVRQAGGTLGRAMNDEGMPMGPLRAWPGGITCANGLGDADCGSLVSPEPHCGTLPLGEVAAVIIASDGLWDAVSFSSATKIALATTEPSSAAEKLVARAIRARGLRDDTTVIVLVCGAAPRGCMVSETSDSSNEGVAVGGARGGLYQEHASPAGSRALGSSSRRNLMKALLRPPRSSDGDKLIDTSVSVKGGRLFESLAAASTPQSPSRPGAASYMFTAGGVPAMPGLPPIASNDSSVHSERSYVSHHSSTSSSEGSPTPMRRMLASSCESPSDAADGGVIPLFGFFNSVPPLCLSPSGSREQLMSLTPGSGRESGVDSTPSRNSKTTLTVTL